MGYSNGGGLGVVGSRTRVKGWWGSRGGGGLGVVGVRVGGLGVVRVKGW